MRNLVMAVAVAGAMGCATFADDVPWFDGGLDNSVFDEVHWPDTAWGGTWSNVVGQAEYDEEDTFALVVDAAPETPLAFNATIPKELGTDTTELTFAVSAEMTPCVKLPAIDPGAKAGVIAFKGDADVPTYWVLAKDGETNGWQNTGLVAEAGQTAELEVTFREGGSATYRFYGLDQGVIDVNVAISDASFSGVDIAGSGVINSLSADYLATVAEFSVPSVEFADVTVTVDGIAVEPRHLKDPDRDVYRGEVKRPLVVTYKAREGFLFPNGTDTYVYEGVVVEDQIATGVEPARQAAARVFGPESDERYYLTFKEAFDAVKDGETLEICCEEVVAEEIELAADRFETGLTIDLGEHELLFTNRVYSGAAGGDIAVQVWEGNNLLIKNGTIGTAEGKCRFSHLIRFCSATNDLMLSQAYLDGHNLIFDQRNGSVNSALTVEGGNCSILDDSLIGTPYDPDEPDPSRFCSIKFGNDIDPKYSVGTLSIDDSCIVDGPVLLTGGTFAAEEDSILSGCYYGRNLYSSWNDATNALCGVFQARTGELPETGEKDNVAGRLYFDFRDALESESKLVTIIKSFVLDEISDVDLRDKTLVISPESTLRIDGDVDFSRNEKKRGGIRNLGTISVAQGAFLGMEAFGFGSDRGIFLDPNGAGYGTFSIAGKVEFAKGNDPRVVERAYPLTFDGTAQDAQVLSDDIVYTYDGREWTVKAPAETEFAIPLGVSVREFTEVVNGDPEKKAQYLIAPQGVETTDDYRACFNAVPTGGDKVKFALNEDGTNAVAAAQDEAKALILEAVLASRETGEGAVSLVIEKPLLGFYYGLFQQRLLMDATDSAPPDIELAGKYGDDLRFNLQKWPGSGFYLLRVSPTIVTNGFEGSGNGNL